MTGSRRAAFLDRDGTLIEDAIYLAHADGVRLLPGAPEAVRALNDRDILVIIITNQSGIAQGLLTASQYEATRDRLIALMADHGARIDATYHCPHYPAINGPCDCRKPGTLLYRQAAKRFDIDLASSLYAGDRDRDVAPGRTFGGYTRLVPSPSTPEEDLRAARASGILVDTLGQVVEAYLGQLGRRVSDA